MFVFICVPFPLNEAGPVFVDSELFVFSTELSVLTLYQFKIWVTRHFLVDLWKLLTYWETQPLSHVDHEHTRSWGDPATVGSGGRRTPARSVGWREEEGLAPARPGKAESGPAFGLKQP